MPLRIALGACRLVVDLAALDGTAISLPIVLRSTFCVLRFQDWTWHQVNACGLPFHRGYAAQGETLETMLDRHRDERQGRARLSCRCCIFTHPRHLTAALQNDPAVMAPAIARVRAYEQASGFSWQQRGPIDELMVAEPAPRYRQQLLLPAE